MEAFRRFAVSLRTGGYALFDMNTTRELACGYGGSAFLHHLSGGTSIWESEWDAVSRIHTLIMTNFICAGDGLYRLSEEVHRERAYDTDFIIKSLKRAGFSGIQAYDANGLSAVGGDTRRVQFLAKR